MTCTRESVDITDKVNALNQSICNLQLQNASPLSPYRHRPIRKSSRFVFGQSEKSSPADVINTDESRRNLGLYQESLIEMAESVRF